MSFPSPRPDILHHVEVVYDGKGSGRLKEGAPDGYVEIIHCVGIHSDPTASLRSGGDGDPTLLTAEEEISWCKERIKELEKFIRERSPENLRDLDEMRPRSAVQ